MGLDEIVDELRTDITEGRFNVTAIAGDEHSCDWAYSVGLQRCFGHPELLIVGLEAALAGGVIEILGNRVASGGRLDDGAPIMVAEMLRLESCEVDPLWLSCGEWFNLGREVMAGWGDRWPRTIQLLWPDESGRYPQLPGDPEWTFRQPLLSIGARS